MKFHSWFPPIEAGPVRPRGRTMFTCLLRPINKDIYNKKTTSRTVKKHKTNASYLISSWVYAICNILIHDSTLLRCHLITLLNTYACAQHTHSFIREYWMTWSINKGKNHFAQLLFIAKVCNLFYVLTFNIKITLLLKAMFVNDIICVCRRLLNTIVKKKNNIKIFSQKHIYI